MKIRSLSNHFHTFVDLAKIDSFRLIILSQSQEYTIVKANFFYFFETSTLIECVG
jgi:hypothetical protein